MRVVAYYRDELNPYLLLVGMDSTRLETKTNPSK